MERDFWLSIYISDNAINMSMNFHISSLSSFVSALDCHSVFHRITLSLLAELTREKMSGLVKKKSSSRFSIICLCGRIASANFISATSIGICVSRKTRVIMISASSLKTFSNESKNTSIFSLNSDSIWISPKPGELFRSDMIITIRK